MENLKIKSILFLFVVVSIFGCKKDDEVAPNKEEVITGGSSKSWKITGAEGKLLNSDFSAFTIDFYNDNKVYSGGQEIPATLLPAEFQDVPTYPECAKDDLLIFKSDKTYESNRGAKLCVDANEFVLLTKGTWALSSDEKTLILTDNSGTKVEYTLEELTTQKMKGNTTGSVELQGTNVDYSLVTTFTAQ